jgi:hypothetical protein
MNWRKYRFGLPDLSEPQNRAITTLILVYGGHARNIELRSGAAVGVRTLRVLANRGYLECGHDVHGWPTIQVSDHLVSALCREMHNPHPVPVMQAVYLARAAMDEASNWGNSWKEH